MKKIESEFKFNEWIKSTKGVLQKQKQKKFTDSVKGQIKEVNKKNDQMIKEFYAQLAFHHWL